MTDPASIPTLPTLLSAPRLQSYVAATRSAAEAARLYTWNVEVSAAFWGEVHVLEVVVRNAMHAEMSARFERADWWQSSRVSLHHVMSDQLATATSSAAKTARRHQRTATADDVVAALTFAFWTGLLGRSNNYETRYWNPALARAFPRSTVTRAELHRELDSVRLFRNRLAHHEPIFGRHLAADHASIVRLAGYVSSDAAAYIGSHSRVAAALRRRTQCLSTGSGASF